VSMLPVHSAKPIAASKPRTATCFAARRPDMIVSHVRTPCQPLLRAADSKMRMAA
jgi:hypothetical protein